MGSPARLRVAMTVEQLWQPVPGGSGSYIRALSAALQELPDLDLRGVAARPTGAPDDDWAPSVPVATLPRPRLALYESWQRLSRPRVERATGPVDVVHATTWAVPPRSAPLVVTVHDLAFLHDAEHFTRRGNAYFRRALDQVRRTADIVITPSRHSADDCVSAGIPEARIRVVPHGSTPVPIEDFDVAAFRARTGIVRPYLLWTGTREPRKNLPRLLDAFRRVRSSVDLDLVLVGPVGWGADLSPSSDDLERVHVLGTLATAELHAAYAGAHAFCYPSLREGFGLPVLEALSHGIPVITSSGSPMAEVAQDAAVLVDPEDTAALADAIGTVAGPAREPLAAAARLRAQQYSWGRAAELTAAAYRDAIIGVAAS